MAREEKNRKQYDILCIPATLHPSRCYFEFKHGRHYSGVEKNLHQWTSVWPYVRKTGLLWFILCNSLIFYAFWKLYTTLNQNWVVVFLLCIWLPFWILKWPIYTEDLKPNTYSNQVEKHFILFIKYKYTLLFSANFGYHFTLYTDS